MSYSDHNSELCLSFSTLAQSEPRRFRQDLFYGLHKSAEGSWWVLKLCQDRYLIFDIPLKTVKQAGKQSAAMNCRVKMDLCVDLSVSVALYLYRWENVL